jgi:ParB family chromosome partitioning protein
LKKKGVLGKGLDALIQSDDSKPQESVDKSNITVSIHKIYPNPLQPRKQFTEKSIDELSRSIAENGVIQPILVRNSNKGFEIVAGERRWRAAQKAGVNEVPVIIKDVSDLQSIELALIENLQREDLNPVEEAKAYEMLISKYELTHEEIAKQIGKERTTITNQLRLLKLTQKALDALSAGTITQGHARALLSLENDAKINQVLDKIISAGLSVRNTEALIKKLLQSETKKEPSKPDQEDLNLKFYTNQLKTHFNTNVRITSKKGKGKIEIDYHSLEDFDRIVKKLIQ